MKTIALLLARKGSKGLKSKNKINILGRPAFTYPILAAKHSKFIEEIIISTDDDFIIEYAKKNNIRLVKRPDYLATDSALFEDALIDAYRQVKETLNLSPKYVVILLGNALTVDNKLIDQAIEKLENNPNADSAVSVSKFNMYSPLRARKLNIDGYLDPFVPFEAFGDPKTLNCDRDSQGDVYFFDCSYAVVRSQCLEHIENGLLPQKFMGQKILPVYNTFGCDIDEEWQIDMTARWLRDQNFSETETPYND